MKDPTHQKEAITPALNRFNYNGPPPLQRVVPEHVSGLSSAHDHPSEAVLTDHGKRKAPGTGAHGIAEPITGLLVMDRVTLDEGRRGQGLGEVFAMEVILRLMPGCRAVACSPGVTDLTDLTDLTGKRLRDQAEWDRVTVKITHGWERLGFRHHQGTVYLLSPASQVLEEQRDVQRRRLADLGASWRAAQPELS